MVADAWPVLLCKSTDSWVFGAHVGLRAIIWGMFPSPPMLILGAVMCPCAVLCVKANMCALGFYDSEGCHLSLCRAVCQSQHVCTWIMWLRAVRCPCAVLCVKASMCAPGLHDSAGYIVFLCRDVCQSQHVCHLNAIYSGLTIVSYHCQSLQLFVSHSCIISLISILLKWLLGNSKGSGKTPETPETPERILRTPESPPEDHSG
jgi:hypothetical protein